MKRLFFIPLLSLCVCISAWGESTHYASTFAELKSALSAAANGDIVELTADIAYPTNGSDLLNITKSITLDGKGHKISGYGSRGGQPNVIAINYSSSSYVDVTLKNLDIYSTQYRPVETRGYITKLTLDNVNITSTGGSSNPQGLTIGGYQTSEPYAQLIIKNSNISVTASGYPVIFWNPTTVTLENSNFNGYCGLYFKTDSKHSVVNADACNFDAPNVHNGHSNAFAVFALEDGDMTFNLNNCGMNADKLGDQGQALFSLSEWTLDENRSVGSINITLSGDNSHFNASSDILQNGYIWLNPSGDPQYGPKSENYYVSLTENDAVNVSVNFTITGGTYSVNPTELIFQNKSYMTKEGDSWMHHYEAVPFSIPSTCEVTEIKQGDVTLYRVVKKAASYVDPETSETVLYDLNDHVPVEGIDNGNNPVSSFDLSIGDTMKLNQETTTAGYVQVSDKITEDPVTHEKDTVATTIQVGKTVVDQQTQEETKVDQVLVINNGLDVQGESQVVVQAGSTLQIGEGGINTENPENIVIEADENGAASLLLNPEITVNQTPNLTVRMLARQIGRDASNDWYWHRFAMPVDHIEMWEKEGNLVGTTYPTYVYAWDYENNDWANIAPSAMVPLQGYTLTLNSKTIPGAAADGGLNVLQDVVYTFKGNLVGNTDQGLNFQHEGFNFFGNSYTGYMNVRTVIEGIESDFVDGTVYMWDNVPGSETYQTYVPVTMYQLTNTRQYNRLPSWKKEVAPMQTFIMRLRGADSADESVSYAAAIWGNPRYGNNNAAPAPARRKISVHSGGNANDPEDAYMEIIITAANGTADRVSFTELQGMSDAFERDYDAEKFMNENHINMYSTLGGMNMSTIVTDNLLGKTISLQTLNDVNYTISFEYVEGTEYALLDKATNTIINIDNTTTYNFSAQPNSTIEGRFEIVGARKVPTAIEDAEVNANVKGIYTLLGQYVGEDFNVLPAGVYIMNGVKVVK